MISCYTDPATQDRVQEIFEYTAGLFDEIMIDDFWFTDCECGDCDTARQAQTVTIGEKTYPVVGNHLGGLPLRTHGATLTRTSPGRRKRVNPKRQADHQVSPVVRSVP